MPSKMLSFHLIQVEKVFLRMPYFLFLYFFIFLLSEKYKLQNTQTIKIRIWTAQDNTYQPIHPQGTTDIAGGLGLLKCNIKYHVKKSNSNKCSIKCCYILRDHQNVLIV